MMNKGMNSMIRIVLLILLITVWIGGKAQTYNSSNSLTRVGLVFFFQDEKGFYQKKENVNLNEVSQIVSTYGYDKKSHELYVQTERANCIVTVNDDLHKVLKKSKSIPQMKGDELLAKAAEISNEMDAHFKHLNELRQKHINDSIQKAKEDSIRKAREDSIKLVKLAKQKEDYRNSHRWPWIPINKTQLSCSLCDKKIYSEDSLFCVAYKNDTLYHITWDEMALEESYMTVHKLYVPTSLRANDRFKYHVEVFKDSLFADMVNATKNPESFNLFSAYGAMQKVKAKAPNGYFNNWEWGSEYGTVTFNFEYTNTNAKTIKYIEVFWRITNGVGDVRRTGSFRGTGPLEEWETASWNWDYSTYFVAGDASEMDITKVIITYMNGTKVTIPKSKLWFNN